MSFAEDAVEVFREAATTMPTTDARLLAAEMASLIEKVARRTREEFLVELQKQISGHKCKRKGHGARGHWDVDDMWVVMGALQGISDD